MKFLFVTYRWSKDVVGGAELIHRRLATELRELGHEVEVICSTGHQITPYHHWAVQWSDLPAGTITEDGITIHRLYRRRIPKLLLFLFCILIERRMGIEEGKLFRSPLAQKVIDGTPPNTVSPFTGWYHPELGGTVPQRWTRKRFTMVVGPLSSDTTLVIKGYSPSKNRLRISATTGEASIPAGEFEVAIPLRESKTSRLLRCRVSKSFRPLKDHRNLGIIINEMSIQGNVAPLTSDHRQLCRKYLDDWRQYLLKRARARSSIYNRMMDYCRGPIIPSLRRAVDEAKADHTIFFNMPWATVSGLKRDEYVMPFWHTDDDYYAWGHWIKALKRSAGVLAISPETDRHFFPKSDMRSHFIGPAIWNEAASNQAELRRHTREELRLDESIFLVLTVCRKTSEKGYRLIAEAVAALRAEGLALEFVGIGPDDDGLPLDKDGCRWLPAMNPDEIGRFYAAADCFSLMSESESFGMVVVEAWHSKLPVIVNRECAALAALVEDDETGLHATGVEELKNALRRLYTNKDVASKIGHAGNIVARRDYTRGAAARRLVAALASAK